MGEMSKEEAEAYDNDPDISMAFADPNSCDSDSSESEYIDTDEFEYDADGHAIFPFQGCRSPQAPNYFTLVRHVLSLINSVTLI